MDNLIIIVARMGSRRLPGKALRVLWKEYVCLEFLVLNLLTTFEKREIVIATSNDRSDDGINVLSEKLGIRCYRGDLDDVLGRILGAVSMIDNAIKNIVRVTGDNPLSDPGLIKDMIDAHLMSSSDYTCNHGYPIGTKSEIISTAFLRFLYTQIEDKAMSEYLTYYLLQDFGQKNCVYHSEVGVKDSDTLSFTIDTEDDLEFVKRVLSMTCENFPIDLSIICKNAQDVQKNLNIPAAQYIYSVPEMFKIDSNARYRP